MNKTDNLRKSQYAMQAVDVTDKAEFSSMLASNVSPKWFTWLMENYARYLFGISLILTVIRFGITLYQFAKSPNKNIYESSHLWWNALQTAVVAVAIIGSVLAGVVFALATPILFMSTMVADILRHIVFFAWNVGKLAALYLSAKNQINNLADVLAQSNYEALKKQYVAKIKYHAFGLFLGVVVGAAVSIIFLFPHIGLAAIGATVFVVAGVKLTVAGVAGAVAASALILPLLKKPIQWAFSKIKSAFVHPKPVQPLLTKIDGQLNRIQDNQSAHSYASKPYKREVIISHIEDKEVAKETLHIWVDKKIGELARQIESNADNRHRFFTISQSSKRQQKLFAMLLVKYHLGDDKQKAEMTNNHKHDSNFMFSVKEHAADPKQLIGYIEDKLPEVRKSFYLEQSDTQNIIESVKLYMQKCDAPSTALKKT